jgi:signal transduction histidine kinase
MMTWMVIACMAVTLTLGGALLWYFLAAIVLPLRRMMAEAGDLTATLDEGTVRKTGDELQAVGAYLRGLMADVVESRSAVADSRRRLMNAEKLAGVGKLAASVAHEIRNPLTAVKMLLFSIQRASEDNPQIDRKLRTVSEEIHRLESIVRNFLEFSKPPSLRLRRQSVREPLEKTLQLFLPRLTKSGIDLVRKDADCLPDVMADSEQLKQVLLNLLQNAAEATGDGGRITVSTALEPDTAAGAMVVVRIEDTGRGMPSDVQSRLFEPFFTTKREGTGLGLCIAGQIMMGHKGRLVLESSTPEGTRFAVFVPAIQDAAHE